MSHRPFQMAFLADMQLGMYATFSGMTEAEVARYAAVDMRVDAVPAVEGFEWDASHYRRAVKMVNGLRPDLVVVGGDMIDDPNGDDQIEAFFEITAGIDPAIPVRYAPGNHDVAPDTVVPTRDSIARYRDTFGPNWYTFTEAGVTFLVLDTVVIDHPQLVPDEWAAEQAFIDETLDTIPPDVRIVAIGHHPLFLDHPDEPDTYWNLPHERRRPLFDRLHAAGVRLALAGHWHRNNVAVHHGFEMVTSGPVGYPLGADPSGFRIVEVHPDRIAHAYLALTE